MNVKKVLDKDVFFNASDTRKVIPLNNFTGLTHQIILHIPNWTNTVQTDLKIVSDQGGLVYKLTSLEQNTIHSILVERVIDRKHPSQLVLELSGAPGGNGGKIHVEIFAKEVKEE